MRAIYVYNKHRMQYVRGKDNEVCGGGRCWLIDTWDEWVGGQYLYEINNIGARIICI